MTGGGAVEGTSGEAGVYGGEVSQGGEPADEAKVPVAARDPGNAGGVEGMGEGAGAIGAAGAQGPLGLRRTVRWTAFRAAMVARHLQSPVHPPLLRRLSCPRRVSLRRRRRPSCQMPSRRTRGNRPQASCTSTCRPKRLPTPPARPVTRPAVRRVPTGPPTRALGRNDSR